ncbi:unnamed protein product [Tetraodon nigroviridis]|uniref:(spotted green pufferfish) hypothetical protein n=1 Tax=Tetraodon nigroviridis TaxID=99883 RepID=Q4SH27_TETNG|nr:unnamed protein product [Tetraodon nigroviridis]
MADAEVIVSSGDLSTGEAEGGSSGNNQNAQVILHLQPVLQG